MIQKMFRKMNRKPKVKWNGPAEDIARIMRARRIIGLTQIENSNLDQTMSRDTCLVCGNCFSEIEG